MEVFRITRSKYSKNLYASGYPARWNSKNNFVIYSASSRSLAALENLVHLKTLDLINYFNIMVIYIPQKLSMLTIEYHDLPIGWHQKGWKGEKICREIGDTWYKEQKYAVLKVPSVIVKDEYNYIVNTVHSEFDKIKLIDTESFLFDHRLKK